MVQIQIKTHAVNALHHFPCHHAICNLFPQPEHEQNGTEYIKGMDILQKRYPEKATVIGIAQKPISQYKNHKSCQQYALIFPNTFQKSIVIFPSITAQYPISQIRRKYTVIVDKFRSGRNNPDHGRQSAMEQTHEHHRCQCRYPEIYFFRHFPPQRHQNIKLKNNDNKVKRCNHIPQEQGFSQKSCIKGIIPQINEPQIGNDNGNDIRHTDFPYPAPEKRAVGKRPFLSEILQGRQEDKSLHHKGRQPPRYIHSEKGDIFLGQSCHRHRTNMNPHNQQAQHHVDK